MSGNAKNSVLTMSRIAEELGLCRNTVSAVINGRHDKLGIAEDTRKRILDYLDTRGYVRAQSALRLKKGAAPDLPGIIYCGDFINVGHLLRALRLLTNGVKSETGTVEITGVDTEFIKNGLAEQIAKGVRRLIWIHAQAPEIEIKNAERLFPLLERLDKVIVYNYDFIPGKWDAEYLKRGISLVGFDRAGAYRRVASLFRRSGHRRIALHEAFFKSNAPIAECAGRFLDIFRDAGFEIFGVTPLSSTPDMAKEMTKNIIGLHHRERVTCFFVRSDNLAAEAIHGIRSAGLRVPDDIAVMGFGNADFCAWLPVPLSSIEIPVAEMCGKTLALMDGGSPGTPHVFEAPLALRQSHIKITDGVS
jgi:DNA-binding LacI/PurR family transcriptional regulator